MLSMGSFRLHVFTTVGKLRGSKGGAVSWPAPAARAEPEPPAMPARATVSESNENGRWVRMATIRRPRAEARPPGAGHGAGARKGKRERRWADAWLGQRSRSMEIDVTAGQPAPENETGAGSHRVLELVAMATDLVDRDIHAVRRRLAQRDTAFADVDREGRIDRDPLGDLARRVDGGAGERQGEGFPGLHRDRLCRFDVVRHTVDDRLQTANRRVAGRRRQTCAEEYGGHQNRQKRQLRHWSRALHDLPPLELPWLSDEACHSAIAEPAISDSAGGNLKSS